jgi:hypothetical protein
MHLDVVEFANAQLLMKKALWHGEREDSRRILPLTAACSKVVAPIGAELPEM